MAKHGRRRGVPRGGSGTRPVVASRIQLGTRAKWRPGARPPALDMALKVREARGERLTLSADYSENQKWACGLLFALMGQVSLAAVHLDRARPQIAAMVIFTVGIVTVIGLVAAHELPFSPPLVVSPEPLAELLKIVPDN